jgi:hypothetical protein
MSRRRDTGPYWPWLVLVAIALASRSTGATTPPPQGRMRMNPRTGKPIVQPGIHALSSDELRALLTQTGFADLEKAFAIAKRESGGVADVVVDTRGMTLEELRTYWGKPALEELSVGLFQINVLAHPEVPGATVDAKVAALKDPHTNASIALAISQGGRLWTAWGG